jgi:multicomponent Na+:H+ antiporter subunit F
MVTISLLVALGILVLLTLLATVRVVTGPTLPDRLVAGDLTIALLTFVLAVAAALGGSEFYLDAALAAALLAFTSTVVLAKFIAEGRVLE